MCYLETILLALPLMLMEGFPIQNKIIYKAVYLFK